MAEQGDVRSTFAIRRRRSRIVAGIAVVFGVVVMLGADRASGLVWGVDADRLKPFAIALLAFLIWAVITWRCPACGHLFLKEWNPVQCRGCGVQLQ